MTRQHLYDCPHCEKPIYGQLVMGIPEEPDRCPDCGGDLVTTLDDKSGGGTLVPLPDDELARGLDFDFDPGLGDLEEIDDGKAKES